MTIEDLFEDLAARGIVTRTYEHSPVRTVEEAKRLRGDLPGGHCKNLLLTDRGGQLFLVVALEDQRIDLKGLAGRLGADRSLSFARAATLMETLGVETGAVTPLAAPNDREGRVRVVLERAMLDIDPLNFHPLRNDRTTAIAPADLVRFLTAHAHEPDLIDL